MVVTLGGGGVLEVIMHEPPAVPIIPRGTPS